jgi:outer membrane protein assembly factor BamB
MSKLLLVCPYFSVIVQRTMHRFFLLLSGLMFVQPLATQSPLVWESRRDFSGGDDRLSSVVTLGDIAVTAGTAGVPGGPNLAVLSYSPNGHERWTDTTPLIPGFTTGVFAAGSGNNVFVAGYTNVPNDSDIFVRAYDAKNGDMLWHDAFSKGRDDLPKGLAAGPSALVVVGQGGNSLIPPFTSIKGIVRAYQPVTGRILWEDLIDGGSVNVIAQAVFVTGDQVFVAARGANMIVRAYRAATGALLWEIQRPGVFPAAIAARGDWVFVAGNDPSNSFIAAFNARDGRLIWEDASTPGMFADVEVQNRQVVGVGHSLAGSMVRVYDTANGELIWQHITTPSGFGAAESLSAVALSSNVVYATGYSSPLFRAFEVLVRAYNLSDGTILLEDRSHLGRFSEGSDIAIGTRQVYAVGTASDNDSVDFLIRAYDRAAIERN